MGIKVYTIFPTKTKFADNCFRVCVDATNLTNFCDPTSWPRDVAIRDWIHKKSKDGDANAQGRHNTQPSLPINSSDSNPGVRSWAADIPIDIDSQLSPGMPGMVCN